MTRPSITQAAAQTRSEQEVRELALTLSKARFELNRLYQINTKDRDDDFMANLEIERVKACRVVVAAENALSASIK